METPSLRLVGRWAGCAGIGLLVGLVGTGVHRAWAPWGLLLALATVLLGGVLARAWSGWVGMLVLALAVVTTVGTLALRGPGGDVLIAAQPVGYVWYAGALVVVLAGLLPARWFADEPRPATS